MKTRFTYALQSLQKDLFWLPLALMALFLVVIGMLPVQQRYDIARAYLGFVLPLICGGLSAYAFLADSALELVFSTRHSAWLMVVERLGINMAVIALTSLLFQLGVGLLSTSLTPLGGLWQRQLVWLVPCLTMLAVGGAASLAFQNNNAGFALVGGIWIMQVILRGWLARHQLLRYLLLFFGAMAPQHPARALNQVSLSCLAMVLLLVTQRLLMKQERYI